MRGKAKKSTRKRARPVKAKKHRKLGRAASGKHKHSKIKKIKHWLHIARKRNGNYLAIN
jgi:hypothetical protein